MGSGFINSDDFFNYVDDEVCGVCTDCDFEQLTSTNAHTNAIDIYILPPNVYNGGKANEIPGSAVVIGGNLTFNGVNTVLPSSGALSHEIGHCLGLFHTFRGSAPENHDCNGPVSCPELVNGDNGKTCGDFVPDSPVDPVKLF